MALVWDFTRQLDPTATPGSTVSYFDEISQSFYIDSGQIKTQIGQLHQGQWQNLIREPEVIISDTGYGALDIEHNFNGTVFGMAQHNADVVFFIYEYMLDITSWIDSGSWNLAPDNPIKLGSLSVKNADKSRFEDDAHTLFAPGSKIRCWYSYGDSSPEIFCLFFIEHSPYDNEANTFQFTGRNRLGFSLVNQKFDERTTYAGTRTEAITQMLLDAGVIPAAILVQEDATEASFTFESQKNYLEGITEATTLIDWYFDDLPDGTIVIGDAAYIKANAAKTGIYTFDLGTDVISRSVSREIDGVYSRVCVRRKGNTPLSLYADIPYFEGWYIGTHKTFYQEVPDITDQTTMERIRDQLVEGMQYSGITETFEGLLRPWLQIGDVAIVTSKGVTRIAGIMSDIKNVFGENAWKTTFTVTSGGTISDPDNPSTVATKYSGRMGGANRPRRLTDYLLSGSNTLTGTSSTGDTGVKGDSVKGDPGDTGPSGDQGASAYEVWQSLGNTGTEQDFIDSLSKNAVPIGAVQLWPTGTAPTDWMLGDGQAISRTTYADLFALVGTTYGVGDGTTTFNLPTLTDPVTGISYMIKVL